MDTSKFAYGFSSIYTLHSFLSGISNNCFTHCHYVVIGIDVIQYQNDICLYYWGKFLVHLWMNITLRYFAALSLSYCLKIDWISRCHLWAASQKYTYLSKKVVNYFFISSYDLIWLSFNGHLSRVIEGEIQ